MNHPTSPRKIKVRRCPRNGPLSPLGLSSPGAAPAGPESSPGKKVRKIRMRIKCGDLAKGSAKDHISKEEILKILKEEQANNRLPCIDLSSSPPSSPNKKSDNKSVTKCGNSVLSRLSASVRSRNTCDDKSTSNRSTRSRRSFLQNILPQKSSIRSVISGITVDNRSHFSKQTSSRRSVFSAMTMEDGFHNDDESDDTVDLSPDSSEHEDDGDDSMGELLAGLLRHDNKGDAEPSAAQDSAESDYPQAEFVPPNFIVIPRKKKNSSNDDDTKNDEEEQVFDYEEGLRRYRQEESEEVDVSAILCANKDVSTKQDTVAPPTFVNVPTESNWAEI